MCILTLIIFVAFAFSSASADSSVTININNGDAIVEVPKGGTATFELNTSSTTTTEFGYTLSVYNRTVASGITMEKCNDSACSSTVAVSTDSKSPTAVESTYAPSQDKNTVTKYKISVDSGVAGSDYNLRLGYILAENEPMDCALSGKSPECIAFTINTTDGTYNIPTSGRVADMDHNYDWDVYVDGAQTTSCANGNCTGTSGVDSAGIALTNLASGQHRILIVSHNTPEVGWGNAFGHRSGSTDDGANTIGNKDKLISIDLSLTTMTFLPKVTESTNNASYMFANMFMGCTNLIAPAVLLDTYKLPNSITNLSWFFSNTYGASRSMQQPMDLMPLSDWLNSNISIIDLSNFLYGTYAASSQTAPVDLSPLSGWFNANSSIANLSGFLGLMYGLEGLFASDLLVTTIDLSPLSNWFSANNSITDLSSFLSGIYYLTPTQTTIDFAPLQNWFSANTSITNLSSFLALSNLITVQALPIDLTPISGWFNSNSSITNLSSFLSGASILNASTYKYPINLAPISNWFNANISIVDISNFFYGTYYNNTIILAPTDFTPLSGWFTDGRSFDNVEGFLYETHYNNPSLILSGQTIFPNWIKTATQGSTPLYNVGFYSMLLSKATFGGMFTFESDSLKSDDIAEPKFQDGTVFSSVGKPTYNKSTYKYRTGITPVNSNWQ